MNGFDQYAPTRGPVPWKTIAIVGGTVVLIILIILGARWLISTKTEAGQQAVAIERVSSELDRTLLDCNTAEDPEQCRMDKVEAGASSIGAAEICNKLSDDTSITCVWQVALEQLDPKDCENINDDEKQEKCSDSVYRALATKDQSLSWCEKIISDVTRTRCVNILSEEIAKTKGCVETGVDQAVCDRQTALNTAVASGDPAQCLVLTNNSDQVNCLDVVGVGDKDYDGLSASTESKLGTSDESADSDGDGLSDYDEYHKYKTDPAKSDTDSDGYSDKVEIDGGYNPLGEGKL